MAQIIDSYLEATHRYPKALNTDNPQYTYVKAEGVADAAQCLQKHLFARIDANLIEKNMGGGVYDLVKPVENTPAWSKNVAPNHSKRGPVRPYDPTKDATALLEKTLKRLAYNQTTLGNVKTHLAKIVEREVAKRCK